MKKFIHDWNWAYHKIREWHCGYATAVYRALLYALRGNSGAFMSHEGKRKSHIYRDKD